MKTYFLASDDDGHWYIIPTENRIEWNKWIDLDDDDQNKWEVPSFVKQIDHPSHVEFYLPGCPPEPCIEIPLSDFTDEERANLEANARLAGRDVGSHLKAIIFNKPKP